MTEFNINLNKKIQINNGRIEESFVLPKSQPKKLFKDEFKKINFDKVNTKKLEEAISNK